MTLPRTSSLRTGAVTLIGLDEIERAFDRDAILSAVRQSLIDHARGRTFALPPTHVVFEAPPGECHVKVGGHREAARFVIKVASGFYENDKIGLPTSSGLQILMDSATGRPTAILDDQGMLTTWRTVAAAVEAATVVDLPQGFTAGIIGCGEQGRLIAEWLPARTPVGRILLWNRSRTKAAALADRLHRSAPNVPVTLASSVAEVVKTAQLVFTATPATTPLVHRAMLQIPQHIVALGTDTPGKNEIAADVLAAAEWIATDDHSQCLHHGDFGNAVRMGLIDEHADVPLGELLADGPKPFRSLSFVDLTGVAVEDVAIAGLFYDRISARSG